MRPVFSSLVGTHGWRLSQQSPVWKGLESFHRIGALVVYGKTILCGKTVLYIEISLDYNLDRSIKRYTKKYSKLFRDRDNMCMVNHFIRIQKINNSAKIFKSVTYITMYLIGYNRYRIMNMLNDSSDNWRISLTIDLVLP